MIWWRGKGIWALALVALVVVSAGKAFGTTTGTAVGLASAAVLVFLLREFWGEEASAFFVPVRFWPVLLLVLSAFTFVKR
jgi:hypothetical protein